MSESLSALVIAGGTEEPIDDVRVITNRSTGRFGAAIANGLARQGHHVHLLASPGLQARPEWLTSNITQTPFSSFASLEAALERTLSTSSPQLVFMAAAIADYSPHPTAGKIPSDQEEIVLRLRKNPKLLSRLRTLCGTASTLIGFKLLSNVSSEELIQVAKAQLQTNHLDLCVANDLAHISPDLHPIWIVSADGSVEHASGDKTTIAKALISRVLEYHNQQQQPL